MPTPRELIAEEQGTATYKADENKLYTDIGRIYKLRISIIRKVIFSLGASLTKP